MLAADSSGGGVLIRTATNFTDAPQHLDNIGGGGGDGGGGSSNSGGGGSDEGGGGGRGGGNRWPRQETVALLKIRSDMDGAFRDANVKAPLWEQVSRKLAELGYHRNSKKCKEKFENVYKYHKRTKDTRAATSEGKNYRFFEQLQALDQHHHHNTPPPPSSKAPNPLNIISTIPSNTTNYVVPVVAMPQTTVAPHSSVLPTLGPGTMENSTNPFSPSSLDMSTSSSTSSDVELRSGGRKRKRNWKEFLERITKEMTRKQEELQKKFLETVEKRERDRTAREDAWRMQERSRFNRERDILVQERSMAADKDAALMAFLQKMLHQQNIETQMHKEQQSTPPPPSAVTPVMPQQPLIVASAGATLLQQVVSPQQPLIMTPAASAPVLPLQRHNGVNLENSETNNNGEKSTLISGGNTSSRWPKVEIQALIKLRTNLDLKYQEKGPKGPLWKDISAGMRKIGYDRNSKRCKEKWENINKYYKKVKESNKKRPQDSKTCPYFEELDALYKDKNKNNDQGNIWSSSTSPPLMVQPEQQWPPAAIPQHNGHDTAVIEDHNLDEDEDEDDDNITDKDDEYEDEEGGGEFEIVANKPNTLQ